MLMPFLNKISIKIISSYIPYFILNEQENTLRTNAEITATVSIVRLCSLALN